MSENKFTKVWYNVTNIRLAKVLLSFIGYSGSNRSVFLISRRELTWAPAAPAYYAHSQASKDVASAYSSPYPVTKTYNVGLKIQKVPIAVFL